MSSHRLPPPPPTTPPPTTAPRAGAFSRLWTLFRAAPIWAQVGLWILVWPFLAALLLVSTPPRPHRWRSVAAVLVLLLATPVWATPFFGQDASAPEPSTARAAEPEPSPEVEPEADPDPEPAPDAEPEPAPDIGALLAAELEAMCQDALTAEDRVAGRLVIREASEQLAPRTDFAATEIARAANRSCGDDLVALGPRAPPASDSEPEAGHQPEPEPDPAPEPEAEPEPQPADGLWTVVRVIDGDTVDVRRGATTERVRVIGIDTPERGECGFGPASDALSELVLNEQVELPAGARDDRDRYDRILRYIDIGDIDAGLHLIEQGLAIARYDSRDGYGRHLRQDAYIAADDATEHVCGVTFGAPTGGSPSASGPSSSSPPTESSSAPASTDGEVVKKSTSDICHAPGTTYYSRTKNFTPYDTVDACLASGGRLPQR